MAPHIFPYPSSTSSSSLTTPTSISDPFPQISPTSFNPTTNNVHDNGWAHVSSSAHIGVIISIILAILVIAVLSFYFCCGGRAWWSRHHSTAAPPSAINPDLDALPLYHFPGTQTLSRRSADEGRGMSDAPPLYAEVAPPEHQTLARATRRSEEEQRQEAAVVSDGKTPLSEIQFEDVDVHLVLERARSEASGSGNSSRDFEATHHGMDGDTWGHSNT